MNACFNSHDLAWIPQDLASTIFNDAYRWWTNQKLANAYEENRRKSWENFEMKNFGSENYEVVLVIFCYDYEYIPPANQAH